MIPAVQTKNLACAPAGAAAPVLSEINLSIAHGCRAALVGVNGAGKSTLLRTLSGLLPPVSGDVLVNGKPAACGNPEIAFLAQRHLIEWHFPVTVRKAVLAGRYPHLGLFRRPKKIDREKADDAIRRLGLSALADRPLDALSGGQQQRVLLARALCQEAKILLLDEPYNGLDSDSRKVLDDFLDDTGNREITIVMATHEIDEAGQRFDSIIRLRDGKLATIHACTCC